MQDGGNDQPRTGVTSSLDNIRARNADGFGKKGDAALEKPAPNVGESRPTPSASGQGEGAEPSHAPETQAGDESTADEVVLTEPEAEKGVSETSEPAPEAVEQGAKAEDKKADMKAVDAEIRMADGANYVGTIYVRESGRVLDFLNEPTPFFALTEHNGKVRLLSKAQVVQLVPYDRSDVTATALRGGKAIM